MARTLATAVVELVGFALVVAGMAQWSTAVALVVAGLVLVSAAAAGDRDHRRRRSSGS